MRKRLILVLGLVTILATALPVGAITDGDLDGEDHPEVVLIIADVGGGPAFRCTGTLIDETHVVTAGHCVTNTLEEPLTGMRIYTESDVQNGDNDYPFGGGNNTVEAVRWEAHSLYFTAPFFVHDVGMIELAEEVELPRYGTLPTTDQLDLLGTRRGLNDGWFTAVGYGLQRINPVFVEAERVRHVATPKLNQINVPGFTGDFSLLLSNNHSTGGTCFGDSGGPNFLRDSNVIAAVTSFGINGNCAGTGGVFRLDRQNVLDFIDGFLNP